MLVKFLKNAQIDFNQTFHLYVICFTYLYTCFNYFCGQDCIDVVLTLSGIHYLSYTCCIEKLFAFSFIEKRGKKHYV